MDNLAQKGITPDQIMTRKAFENAIIVHSAIGGSTNATLHLPAIAKELGIGEAKVKVTLHRLREQLKLRLEACDLL